MTQLILSNIKAALLASGLLLPAGLYAQTALPTGQNLPFSFAGRTVPQLLNGANSFRFSLPANTIYAVVTLQQITPSVKIQLLVRQGQDVGGNANDAVFGDKDDSDNRNKMVQLGFDSRLPIISNQPYFVALSAAESADPISGVLRLDVQTMAPGGTVVEFSGLAQIYLAGQPDGIEAFNAKAPLNSPPPAISVTPGQGVRFQAMGNSTQSASGTMTGPNGDGYVTLSNGSALGLAGYTGPAGGVIGMFLGPGVPVDSSLIGHDYSSDLRNYRILRPRPQVPFFVGSGLLADGTPRTIVVPPGATRLYLGRSYASPTGAGRTVVRVELVAASSVPIIAPANPLRVSAATTINLAGLPDGARDSSGNSIAPMNSPPQVAVDLVPGQALVFRASGQTIGLCNNEFNGPAGSLTEYCGSPGGGNGISGFNARASALIGVFLGSTINTNATPSALDFQGVLESAGTLRPILQQVFLIGDGKLPDGSDRKIIVPTGATRLFVGPSSRPTDGQGAFIVSVSAESANRPVYTKAGVVNGASFEGGPLSVGSIASIFGQNLGSSASATTVPLPRILGGTQVFYDNVPAPLYVVTPGQINVQVPWELGAATRAILTIIRNGVAGAPFEVDLAPYRPALFSAANIGAILVSSRTGALVTPQAPAQAGDVLIGYATGLGFVSASPQTGEIDPGSPLAIGALPTTVVLTSQTAERDIVPFFVGLAPGFIGVFQINFALPTGLGAGTIKIRLKATPFGTSNTAEFSITP